MQKFNMLNVLILSTPQFFLCFMFSLIILGESTEVPFKCNTNELIKSFAKMLGASIIVSVAGNIAECIFPNINIATIVYMIVYSLLLKYLYKLTWVKSIIGVITFAILIISLESLYVPFCIHYFYNGVEANLFNSPELKRFLCFLPERIGQLVVIVSFWDFNFAIRKIKQYKLSIWGFLFIMFIIFFMEVNFTRFYVSYFKTFDLFTKISYGLCCFSSGFLNFMIVYSYIKVITMVSKFHLKGVTTMGKDLKLLSLVDSKVTSAAVKKENAGSFLWGHQPKAPKAIKKIK